MKTKYIHRIFILALIFSISACSSDFLELNDPNSITSGNFWSSPEDVQMAVNTLYPEFNGLWDGSTEASNLRSDATVLTATDFSNFNQYYNFTNTPINGLSDDNWNIAYTLIFRVNTILKEIENIEFADVELKEELIAEAKFFRGMAYFRLAHTYGQVPIVLEPVESIDDQFNNPKAESIEAVWDQAISDLQVAKNGLPIEQGDIGRVTKGAATAFLGKLYLYRAGYLNEDTYYSIAADEFKEVIDLGIYGLVENWNDNFLATNENNIESIYEAQYDIFSGSYSAIQPRPAVATVPGISQELYYKPSQWIFNEMSKERTVDGEYDTRLLNTIYFEGGLPLFGVEFADLGDGIECGSGSSDSGGDQQCWEEDLTEEGLEGFFAEYVDENGPDSPITLIWLNGCWDPATEEEFEHITVTFESGCQIIFDVIEESVLDDGCNSTVDNDGGNFDGWFRKYLNVNLSCEDINTAVNNERILRYSDVLLMYAEALVKSNGDLGQAVDAVNQIRERAQLSPMTLDNAESLMDEIEHQRVMEFVMEGMRYYDLIRWGRLKEALEINGFPNSASNVDEEKHKYFPIPVQEINTNEQLEQNPLWQ